MAVITIPSTSVEQPSQSQTMNEAGSTGMQRSFKDAYSVLETLANAVKKGDTLGGKVVSGYSLQRAPANMGVLSFALVPNDTSSGESPTQTAKIETWTLKSIRNDVSLLAYCGPSAGSNPNRVHLELWLKETDASLAENLRYKRNDADTGTDLTNADRMLAAKFQLGYDSVMRFYPMLTKTRVYTTMPATVYENLARIDTPSVDDSALIKERPGNLASVIGAHSWLKCQDDVQKNADGTFSRTESWIGSLTSERTWDTNFYGSANRWPMPLSSSSGNS